MAQRLLAVPILRSFDFGSGVESEPNTLATLGPDCSPELVRENAKVQIVGCLVPCPSWIIVTSTACDHGWASSTGAMQTRGLSSAARSVWVVGIRSDSLDAVGTTV